MYKAYLQYENYKAKEGTVTEGMQSISLSSAKNSSAAFQLIVRSDEDFILSVSGNPVSDWSGHVKTLRIDVTPGAELYPVGFMGDDSDIKTADLLLHQEYIYVKAGFEQPVWIEYKIPRGAPSDIINGKIDLFEHFGFGRELPAGSFSFEIKILPYEMPDPKDFPFYLDLWQHLSNIARKAETPLWSDAHFRVLEGYTASLAALGQKAVTIVASEVPWSGQSCFDSPEYPSDMFEHSIISVVRRDGKFICDFSACDRYIKLCEKYGINAEIEIFGLVNIWLNESKGFGIPSDHCDGQRIRYCDESAGVYDFMRKSEEIGEYISLVERHFIELGLINKVRIVADEPSDAELYMRRRAFVNRYAPSFKYKAAVFDYKFIEASGDSISDYVPTISGISADPENMMRVKAMLHSRFLWYVCCGPEMPNTFIKSAAVESYAIGWITLLTGFDGFLRWNYTVWPDKPRESIKYKWSAGDTCFVYPAFDGSVILSLRWKALRKAAEIFTLAKAVEAVRDDAPEILDRAYSIIFKTRDLSDFAKTNNFGDVMSTEYGDYKKAEELLIASLINANE